MSRAHGRMAVPALLRYYPRVMQAKRSRLLAHCVVLFAVLFASCSDGDEPVGDRSRAGTAGSCRNCAGEDAGGSDAGGAPGTGASSGNPILSAGRSGSGGSGTGGTANTLGGEGGRPAGDGLEQLGLCARLSKTAELSVDVGFRFEDSIKVDCRVNWIPRLYVDAQKRKDYLNDLLVWNLRFWGCQAPAVEDLGPVYGTPTLSQGDADLVVEHYMKAATVTLSLSSKEQTEMREALARLAEQLVGSISTEPSKSKCVSGEGGAGGVDTGNDGGAGASDFGGAGAGGSANGGAAGAGDEPAAAGQAGEKP